MDRIRMFAVAFLCALGLAAAARETPPPPIAQRVETTYQETASPMQIGKEIGTPVAFNRLTVGADNGTATRLAATSTPIAAQPPKPPWQSSSLSLGALDPGCDQPHRRCARAAPGEEGVETALAKPEERRMTLPGDLMLAIDLYKSSESTVGSLWGLYSGAVLAVLGYILGRQTPVPGRAKIGLAMGFLVFAISNGRSLWRAQCICFAAAEVIRHHCPQGLHGLLAQLRTSCPWVIVGFQAGLTLCVLVSIYAAHVHERVLDTRARRAPSG